MMANSSLPSLTLDIFDNQVDAADQIVEWLQTTRGLWAT